MRELRRITGGSSTCGWMGDENVFVLYALTKWYKPEVVIQTGHLWGKSALVALEALNDGFLTGELRIEDQEQDADRQWSDFVASNSPQVQQSELISIDPAPINVPHHMEGVEYMQSLHPNLRFFQMTSKEFFDNTEQLTQSGTNAKRLMGIVDGDHSWHGCLTDLEGLKDLDAELIVVDDTSWLPHIRRVCQVFAKREGYFFHDFRTYNGLGVLIKESDPPEHLVDGDYSGFPRAAELAYRLGGADLAFRLFDALKRFGACSPSANRLTLGTGMRYLLGRALRKVTRPFLLKRS